MPDADHLHRLLDELRNAGVDVPTVLGARYSDAMFLGEAEGEQEREALYRTIELLVEAGVHSMLFWAISTAPALASPVIAPHLTSPSAFRSPVTSPQETSPSDWRSPVTAPQCTSPAALTSPVTLPQAMLPSAATSPSTLPQASSPSAWISPITSP